MAYLAANGAVGAVSTGGAAAPTNPNGSTHGGRLFNHVAAGGTAGHNGAHNGAQNGAQNGASGSGVVGAQVGASAAAEAVAAGLSPALGTLMTDGFQIVGGGLQMYKCLLDLIPSPIFVRSADGKILYTNRCGFVTLGEASSALPAAWQVTPQLAPTTHSSRRAGDKEGEVDLPRDPVPAATATNEPLPPLPAASHGFSVLIQGRSTPIRAVLLMHRIPFWLASADGSAHSAVCMYVAPVAGSVSHTFYPTHHNPEV
jgi:hypothetical protein